MEEHWEARQSYESKPHKHNIALALVVAAAMFSYAGCYALVGVLQRHDLMDPFKGSDPRPRWFLISFGSLTLLFLGVLGLARLMKHHKLEDDEFAVEEEKPLKFAPPPQGDPAK